MLGRTWKTVWRAGARLVCVAVALAVATSAVGDLARATTLLALDLDQLAHYADAIVIARCEELRFERAAIDAARPDGPKVLRTNARFTRLDTWGGSAPAVIPVVQLGGVEGQRAALVPGAAALEPGRESVLFLQDFHDGTWGIIGLFQGKLDLEHDASGNVWLSRSQGIGEDGGAAPATADSIGMLRLRAVGPDGRISIDAFHEQVAEAIARGVGAAR